MNSDDHLHLNFLRSFGLCTSVMMALQQCCKILSTTDQINVFEVIRVGADLDPFDHLLAAGRRVVGAADADLVVAVAELSRKVGDGTWKLAPAKNGASA